MTPWLALIESNTSGSGRAFARIASLKGVRPILMATDPSRYKYAEADGIEVFRIDTQDIAALLGACNHLASGNGLAGVASSSEYFVTTAATLAAQLGLPGPNPRAVALCRNKYKQRLRLQAEGCAIPAFAPAVSVKEAVRTAQLIGFPVVVKPVSGSGSIGVRFCNRGEEVAVHAATLLQQRNNERGLPVPRRILVESAALGPEYSVETFHTQIIGVTQKYLGPLPDFVEIGHDYPAELPAADQEAMQSLVLSALKALGMGWGPAHMELRLTENGPKIIELNPRLAGGNIPELVRLASGIDLISATIDLVLARQPDLRKSRTQHACIRFLVSETDGHFAGVTGLDEARRLPSVNSAEIYIEPGTPLIRRGDFRDRIGHVITSAETLEDARLAAKCAMTTIKPLLQSGLEM